MSDILACSACSGHQEDYTAIRVSIMPDDDVRPISGAIYRTPGLMQLSLTLVKRLTRRKGDARFGSWKLSHEKAPLRRYSKRDVNDARFLMGMPRRGAMRPYSVLVR